MVFLKTSRRALGAWFIGSTATLRGSPATAKESIAQRASEDSSRIGFLQTGVGARLTSTEAKLRSFVHVTDFDLDPQNAHFAIQRAMNAVGLRGGGEVLLPEGTLTLGDRLAFNHDNVRLIGRGRYATVLIYTPSEGPAIWNPDWASATRYGCGLHHFKLIARNLSGRNRIVIHFGSHQFGTIEDVWALGSGAGCWALLMTAGVSGATECTYNEISNSYFGLSEVGIRLHRGANSNTIRYNRIQIPVPGGIGIDIFDPTVFAPDNLRILGNGIEHPGHVSDGIHLRGDGHIVSGNRFEGLNVAVNIQSRETKATLQGNYYSTCANKIANAGPGILRTEEGGVTFANGSKLDHYEDGNFTPVLEGVTRAGKGAYTLQIGRFSRVGRTVTFQISLAWTSHTGTGTMRLAGLPFPAFDIAGHAVPVQILPSNLIFTGQIGAAVIPGTSVIQIYSIATETGTGGVAITKSGTVHISGSYTV